MHVALISRSQNQGVELAAASAEGWQSEPTEPLSSVAQNWVQKGQKGQKQRTEKRAAVNPCF